MKAFFLSRLLREKVLLFGLIAVAAVMWLSSVSTRVRRFWRDASATSTELVSQRNWLAERGRIESESKAAVAQLDPSRTFDGARLQAELYTIAKSIGIGRSSSIDDANTSTVSQFSINTVRFVIRDVPYQSLKAFYRELSKRSPYIGIEEFSVNGRATTDQVTASLRVSSVEIAR